MNCSEFRNRIIDLLDGRNFTDEERLHLERCPACAAEFRAATEALDAVTPRSNPLVSEELRDRMLTAAASTGPRHRNRILRLAGTAAAAAALLAGVLLFPFRTPAYAARKQFGHAATAMTDLRTLRLALLIRTKAIENFAYTDPSQPFVPCTLTIEYGDTLRWRAEKPQRTAAGDGRTVRIWLPAQGEGWHTPAERFSFADEFGIFSDLRRLMLSEQALACRTAGAEYDIAEEGDVIRLKVSMPAQGDFRESDYRLNSSIDEANTLREYRFDKSSGRLLGLRITALAPDGRRIVLAESTDIAYDLPVDRAALTAFPREIAWTDLAEPLTGTRLTGLSAEEAAMCILQAMGTWDEALLDEALHNYGPDTRRRLAEIYRGLTIIETGKGVHSGRYPGIFIPCKVLLADGKTEKLMLALRNDNPEKCWLVDGGI